MHRILRILSIALITAGLVILADVGLTLAWKEPLSSIYGSFKQSEAEDELAALEERFPPRSCCAWLERGRARGARRASSPTPSRRRSKRGEAIGRIVIPRIDLDIVVVEGTDTASLQKGPGHYTLADTSPSCASWATARPSRARARRSGSPGTGPPTWRPSGGSTRSSRATRSPSQMPYATFTYEVEKHEIVDPRRGVEIVRERRLRAASS